MKENSVPVSDLPFLVVGFQESLMQWTAICLQKDEVRVHKWAGCSNYEKRTIILKEVSLHSASSEQWPREGRTRRRRRNSPNRPSWSCWKAMRLTLVCLTSPLPLSQSRSWYVHQLVRESSEGLSSTTIPKPIQCLLRHSQPIKRQSYQGAYSGISKGGAQGTQTAP